MQNRIVSPLVGSILIADQLGGSHRMKTHLHWMITLASHQNSYSLVSLRTQFKLRVVIQWL